MIKSTSSRPIQAYHGSGSQFDQFNRFKAKMPFPRLEERIPLKGPRKEIKRALAAGAFWAIGSEGDNWYGLPAHACALARWILAPLATVRKGSAA